VSATLTIQVDTPNKGENNSMRMPKRSTGLTDANARLHKNHSYEFLVATWLMQDGWQVFAPLLDAAHAVDLIASDGPNSYRIQIKSLESQDESCDIHNAWKDKHIDYVVYFAQRSNWGYVCPAFATNSKALNHASHQRFQQTRKDFLRAFHACEQPQRGNSRALAASSAPRPPPSLPPNIGNNEPHYRRHHHLHRPPP
jgi:hypothetical protein